MNAQLKLPHRWVALGFAGLKKGEENEYQQLNAGLGFGYHLKPIKKPHPTNIDSDKEYTFAFSGGYERLQVFQSGTKSDENRLVLQAKAGFRPGSRLYLSDRNRIEFRWRYSGYSTRYRNNVQALYDIIVREFHFSPYGSAEFFYDGSKDDWSREQYMAGIEWPLTHSLMLQTYYLRQNNSSEPDHINVGGLTLNLSFK